MITPEQRERRVKESYACLKMSCPKLFERAVHIANLVTFEDSSDRWMRVAAKVEESIIDLLLQAIEEPK